MCTCTNPPISLSVEVIGRELMAPRTDRTMRIPSGVASPVTTNHAAKGSVFVNLRNAGNLNGTLPDLDQLPPQPGPLSRPFHGLGFHTMDYDPFIKSQLAFTRLTLGPYEVQIWSRNTPEAGWGSLTLPHLDELPPQPRPFSHPIHGLQSLSPHTYQPVYAD